MLESGFGEILNQICKSENRHILVEAMGDNKGTLQMSPALMGEGIYTLARMHFNCGNTRLRVWRGNTIMNKPRPMPNECEGLYVTRDEAQRTYHIALIKAGIPLSSITARCMFEPTKDGRGRHNCKFGPTPLWENRLRLVNGKVLKSEFNDWVDRLTDSGRKFQKAGRASWGTRA